MMQILQGKRGYYPKSRAFLCIFTFLILCLNSQAFSVPVYSFVFPVVYPRQSSSFGKRLHPIYKVVRNHTGVDLAAPLGTPVRAIAAGLVIFADPYGGYGNLIVIRHKDQMSSHYGHLKKMKVKPGEKITAGQIIGTIGVTGVTTGPHLHFELRHNGKPLDPVKYLVGFEAEPQG